MFQPDQGCIEVICGSMFSGKSEELIRRVKRALLARQQVQVFKPVLDNRYNKESVTSHSGASFEALPVAKAEDILTQLAPGVKVVGIDEVQFFDQSIVAVCQQLADQGKRVIVAGLDQDFRGEPFGPVPTLLAVAEVIDKLHAVCMSCGRTASRSQRFVNGEVARADDSTIKIGAEQIYEARCRACHKVVKDGGSQADN